MATIAWPPPKKQGAVLWRVPQVIQYNDDIIVNPDEFMVFYYNGWVVGVFSRPGRYTISKSLEAKFPKLFNKLANYREYVELYYIAKRPLDAKFGTKQPLMFEDPRFEIVQIRAFGSYTFRVQDPVKFVQQMVGQYGCSANDEVDERVKERMITLLNTTLGKLKERGLSVVKIPANLNKIERAMIQLSNSFLAPYGITVTGLTGLNLNLPPTVQQAINEMSAVAAMSDKTIEKMTKYETMKAIREGSGVGQVNINVDQIGDKYEIGQIGDSYSTSTTLIQDSVVMRSNIGGGTSGDAPGKGTGGQHTSSVQIQDSIVQRSTIGAGEQFPCPSCGGTVQRGWKMCPVCGTKLEQKCPQCDGDLQEGWKLCPNCGHRL